MAKLHTRLVYVYTDEAPALSPRLCRPVGILLEEGSGLWKKAPPGLQMRAAFLAQKVALIAGPVRKN